MGKYGKSSINGKKPQLQVLLSKTWTGESWFTLAWKVQDVSISEISLAPAPPPPAWGVRIRQHNLPRQERGAVPPIRWFWAGGLQWDIRTRFWRSNVLLHVLQPIYHSRRFNLQDDICYFGMLGPIMMRKKCIIPSKITMRCATHPSP